MQRAEEPPGFADGSGCWARVVWWPEDEVSVLAKREGLADGELLGHSEPRRPGYTDYSRVTFVRKGLPIPLRGTELGYEDCTQLCFQHNDMGDAFALFIRALPGARVVWWYSGKGQTEPDNLRAEPNQVIDNGFGAEQMRDVTLADIAGRLQASKEFYVNEAMLRYRLCDVTGVICNDKSLKSLAKAVGFQRGLLQPRGNLVPLYVYEANTGTVRVTSENAVRTALDDGRPKTLKRYQRKLADYTDFYQTLFEAELRTRK